MTKAKLLGKHNKTYGSRRILYSIASLVIGLIVGVCMARLFELVALPKSDCILKTQNENISNNRSDVGELPNQLSTHTHITENSSTALAQKLYNEVRVLCWVMTSPKNHKPKALHVKQTWGSRCNKLIFISTANDTELDTVALNVTDNFLWARTREALKYIHANHMDDADWFLKADDETYVVVENLRYMLYPYDPETPIYFSCQMKPYVKQGYMSDGAGYVLSKEAVRRLVAKAKSKPAFCNMNNAGAEDAEIGKCLEKVQVIAGDTRETESRGKFFPFVSEDNLNAKIDLGFWYWRNIYYKIDVGIDCCSEYAISFHYVKPGNMHVMDYLIYHLRPYGIVKRKEVLPKKLTWEEILASRNTTTSGIKSLNLV